MSAEATKMQDLAQREERPPPALTTSPASGRVQGVVLGAKPCPPQLFSHGCALE